MTTRIGNRSIKESFDNLPSGICFADRYGIVILCNHQMHRLCHQLMGADLQHIVELRDALSKPQLGVSVIDPSAPVLHFPDDAIWEFRESTVTDSSDASYVQMQAFNVTELYQKRAELETENRRLVAVNERARRLYTQLDQTVRAEETLAVKISIHNRIGLHLLSTHRALARDGTSLRLQDLQALGKVWRHEIEALTSVADMPNEPNEAVAAGTKNPDRVLRDFMDSATGIGVTVVMSGSLPEDIEAAYLLITAMRECATNTVRHALGSEAWDNQRHGLSGDRPVNHSHTRSNGSHTKALYRGIQKIG